MKSSLQQFANVVPASPNPSAMPVSATKPRRVALSLLWMTLAALTTAAGAQVRIPMLGTDVPFTLQTLAVLLTGLVLPPRLALGSMSLYLALGLWQVLPFATPAGLFGPTGGYLVGFLMAAPLVSWMVVPRRQSMTRQLFAAIVGTLVIFAMGIAWRGVLFQGDWVAALSTGLLPFWPEALLKIGLAVAIARSYWAISNRIGTLSEPRP